MSTVAAVTSGVSPARAGEHAHVVGVYDNDDELVSGVVAFLAEGLVGNGSAIVIATAAHRDAIEVDLRSLGLPLDALTRAGRYQSLDAGDALTAFMRGASPDTREFERAVGAMCDSAAAIGGPVRLFGEMVALLWDRGNVAGAIELESLWNDLAEHRSFALLCAYAMSSLEASRDLAATKRMCDRHSSVMPLRGTRPAASYCETAAVGDAYERMFVASHATLRGVRMFTRDILRRWGEDALVREAEVIVSELATNAVRHARSPFRVSISRTDAAIRIAVRDASFDPPQSVVSNAGRSDGRGVQLVAALSDAWGTEPEVDGKTVWAEVTRTRL